MISRIEIYSKVSDTRAAVRKKRLFDQGFRTIKNIYLRDVYTLDKSFGNSELNKIANSLSNPVTQQFIIRNAKSKLSNSHKFNWVIEVGFLPGVTDNVAHTAREIIEDLLKTKFSSKENVYTSQSTYIQCNFSESEIREIASSLYNPLIQRAEIKNYRQYIKDGGMDIIVPEVKLDKNVDVTVVDLNTSDEEVIKIGKFGIKNKEGTRNGPLALELSFMKVIQKHFRKLGRNPTDIELESLAQTWSEHCKHTIFADPLDELKEGLFKTYIKRATEEIRQKKGRKDFCVSVFSDNSGAIAFDENFLITHKVETHNSPSALDPFGGSITGIVGVNRDTIGFGLGAKPITNFYGFCLADPRKDIPLYKTSDKSQKMLSSRKIMDGVIEGVNAGGNQSGIPTPQGFLYFDERYRGKPLVFVGTIGLLPKEIKGKKIYQKKAKIGDYIVMLGGRVGKDGIHGATFSSESLNEGSPATAVQIGDPITQKKLSDALIREARDMLLYNSITDNGAGGLSCSVAEMAKESGGCVVELEKVPLKYSGLKPWEIWVSESQERMTLAIPKDKWKKFSDLMRCRGVEATIIGKYTDTGKCIVKYQGKTIMDIDMQFLHYGLPKRLQKSTFTISHYKEPRIPLKQNLTDSLLEMMSRLNLSSFEFVSQQYDHVVLANSVLGPLQGRGRVNGDTSVIQPVISSKRGLIISQGLYPLYSDIDTYHMAASSLDTAVRNTIAAGANPDYIAILDNFCWCSSFDPKRLGQLRRAAQACYDYAVLYETPFISGKDSMFNDFSGFDEKGKSIKISIPPTLLITSIGVIDDVKSVVSLDAKMPGDLVYILGETFDELGGSEYFAMLKEKNKTNDIGNYVPKVSGKKNKKLYKAYSHCVHKGLIASAQSIGRGGLAVALAKTAIGGMLGIKASLKNLPGSISRDEYALYSESQGRIVVTIAPQNQRAFEKLLQGNAFAQIGKITKELTIELKGLKGAQIVDTNVHKLLEAYRKTFKDY